MNPPTRPPVVAFLKQKGGAGATTLATQIAVAALQAGRRPVVLDVDPQHSAVYWGEDRRDGLGYSHPPVIAAEVVAELSGLIDEAAAAGYDLVLIDTPPHSSATTADVARLANLAVIPTRPEKIDLRALPPMLAIVAGTQTPFVVVLNACPYRAPETAVARAWLDGAGVRVWPREVTDRRTIRRAFAQGQGITEAGTDPKAAEEIEALWTYIGRQI